MTARTLKTCPFCGAPAQEISDPTPDGEARTKVGCFALWCSIQPVVVRRSVTRARAAWNRRSNENG